LSLQRPPSLLLLLTRITPWIPSKEKEPNRFLADPLCFLDRFLVYFFFFFFFFFFFSLPVYPTSPFPFSFPSLLRVILCVFWLRVESLPSHRSSCFAARHSIVLLLLPSRIPLSFVLSSPSLFTPFIFPSVAVGLSLLVYTKGSILSEEKHVSSGTGGLGLSPPSFVQASTV